MGDFFKFYTDINPNDTFPLFGRQHIVAMVLIVLCLSWLIRKMRTMPKQKQDFILKVAAILVPLTELSHALWLLIGCGQSWVKVLPLHLCGMQVFFIPLAVFTNKRYIKEYVYCTSLLGGVMAILFMSGIASNYPFMHFQTIQSLLYHALLIFVPLVFVLVQDFKPQTKNLKYVVYQFFGVVFLAGIIDFRYNENYLFLNRAPEGTPLVFVEQVFGKSAYLLLTLILGIWVCYRMQKLFAEEKPTKPRKKTIYEYSIYEKPEYISAHTTLTNLFNRDHSDYFK